MNEATKEENKHYLEYSMHSCKVSWCPVCLKHFYNDRNEKHTTEATSEHYHLIEVKAEATKELTLSDFQQQVAEKRGDGAFHQQSDYFKYLINNEAAELYAQYKFEQGKQEGEAVKLEYFQKGIKEGSKEARKSWNAAIQWAAEHAEVDFQEYETTISKQSILNGLKQEEE